MLAADLERAVGSRHVLNDAAALRTYECDGLTGTRVRPLAVVLPGNTAEVAAVVKIARRHGVPIVPRGAGTGLSGGALPVAGGIVIGLARLNRILDVDLENRRMRVQPGVINLDVSRRIAQYGYYYAPDPSSQSVCSIGGNVAENAGGAHCLKYGFTANHVVAATVVLAHGEVVELGSSVADPPGYDLLGVFVGSEGMLGIVTEVVVRILRAPRARQTVFATFATTDQAADTVSAIVARGILPAAIEMMDALALEAIVAASGVDWPLDVGAALLVDVDGPPAEVAYTEWLVRFAAESCGALLVRAPYDETERDAMWNARKSAFAAVGRISPNYYVQDGVIPRSQIARVLAQIAAAGQREGVRIANVFHAGDGNLHPLVLYDARKPREEAAALRVSAEILRICLAHGGSITGEHGVGADKAAYLGEQFGDDDLATMHLVRCTFDAARVLNPGKVFPTPRLCGDRPGPYVAHVTERSGAAGRG